MVDQWLLDDFEQEFIQIPANKSLADVKALSTSMTKPILITQVDTVWRVGFVDEVVDWNTLPDNMLPQLLIEDLSLRPVHRILDGSEDSDALYDEITSFSSNVFVVLDTAGRVKHVLINRVAHNDNIENEISFTAFHPLSVQPNRNFHVIVYAHLDNVLDAVRRDAKSGKEKLIQRPIKGKTRIKPGTKIKVVAEFNKDELECAAGQLEKTNHIDSDFIRFDFDFTGLEKALNTHPRIRFSIQIAQIEIAFIEISLLILEDNPQLRSTETSGTSYQRIFISYARADLEIVRKYYQAQVAAGHEVFMDVVSIRTGDNWVEAVKAAIEKADFLQLFWSVNAKHSEVVSLEWQYMLEKHCPEKTPVECGAVIRPVFWQEPMEEIPEGLKKFQFKYVPLDK